MKYAIIFISMSIVGAFSIVENTEKNVNPVSSLKVVKKNQSSLIPVQLIEFKEPIFITPSL